jgi:hypothetical protein
MSVTLSNVRGGDPKDGHTVSFTIPRGTSAFLMAVAGPDADLTEYEFYLVSRDPNQSVWRSGFSSHNTGLPDPRS